MGTGSVSLVDFNVLRADAVRQAEPVCKHWT